MTPYEAYQLFLALKMHFTQPQYDYFKYNGKVNATIQTYEKRRDKFQFAKLAKHKDPMGYLVAQYAAGKFTGWVGDLFGEEGERIYTEYLARRQSLTYLFQSDLERLEEDFISKFKVKQGQHPELLVALRQDNISIETFTILNNLLNFFPIWDKKIQDTVIWPAYRDRSLKYSSFISFDKAKYKSFIRPLVQRTDK
jgi:hypothetical protein